MAGDSSGGNLAAIVALELTRAGAPPSFQALIYPMLDATASSASYAEFAEGYGFTSEKSRWYFDQYLPPGVDRRDPRVSPLFDPDVRELPTTLIVTAECDPLRDDGERYARALREAGVQVELRPLSGDDPRLLPDDRPRRALDACTATSASGCASTPASSFHGGAAPGYARLTVAFRPEQPVGRRPELERLGEVLDDLRQASAACLAVEGEPGIGKTRLLPELRRQAEERGYLVLAGSAAEFERDLPFGVWVDALDADVASQDLDTREDLDAQLLRRSRRRAAVAQA